MTRAATSSPDSPPGQCSRAGFRLPPPARLGVGRVDFTVRKPFPSAVVHLDQPWVTLHVGARDDQRGRLARPPQRTGYDTVEPEACEPTAERDRRRAPHVGKWQVQALTQVLFRV